MGLTDSTILSWLRSTAPPSLVTAEAAAPQKGKRRLLFLTHAEFGQASVHLAVIHALQSAYGKDAEVHLGSFDAFRPRCPPGVTFHSVVGKSMQETGVWVDRLHSERHQTPGLAHTALRAEVIIPTLVPYTPAEYVETAKDVERIVSLVQPDLVISDTLFQQAIDAAWRLGVKHCLLSPNTAKDVAPKFLGICAGNYPMIATGLTYPIPWKQFFQNARAGMEMEQYIATECLHTRALGVARNEAGYTWPLPLPNPRHDTLTLCVSADGFDYPMTLPPYIKQCGPILRPVGPVDSGLSAWLHRSNMRTVLVAFGTHFRLDQSCAENLLTTLNGVMAARDDLQVLWKLPNGGSMQLEGLDRYGDRMRVVDWLESEPVDIMRTGRVAALLHHGGSNSYHEALATGVPQIIVSAWLDCHDFGPRTEYLGVGIWANRHAAPRSDTEELSDAMCKVLCSIDESGQDPYAIRAKDVQLGIHAGWAGSAPGGQVGEGRDVAAELVWAHAWSTAPKDA